MKREEKERGEGVIGRVMQEYTRGDNQNTLQPFRTGLELLLGLTEGVEGVTEE